MKRKYICISCEKHCRECLDGNGLVITDFEMIEEKVKEYLKSFVI